MSHESKLLEQHFSAVAAIEETWLQSFGQEPRVAKVVAVWCPIDKQCCCFVVSVRGFFTGAMSRITKNLS